MNHNVTHEVTADYPLQRAFLTIRPYLGIDLADAFEDTAEFDGLDFHAAPALASHTTNDDI